MNLYTIPNSVLSKDFDYLKNKYSDFICNKITADEFKPIRVSYGIYEQRKANTYMVRIKTNGGKITPKQLASLANLSKTYANGILHITTRAGVQFHYVKFENILKLTKELHKIGLSGHGSGGNQVRGIVSDPLSGVAKDEVFAVMPYANALTSKFFEFGVHEKLPRKFKIAFSGSKADRSAATITDIGFVANIKNGQKGFSVFIAGGMGGSPKLGLKLASFIPANEAFLYAYALLKVFQAHGDYEHKHSARLRYLRAKIGEKELFKLVKKEIVNLRKNSDFWDISALIEDDEILLNLQNETEILPSKEAKIWFKRYAKEQKQNGLYYALIPLNLGDIDYKNALNLAKKINEFGGEICFTKQQNLFLKNLSKSQFFELFPIIKDFSPLSLKPQILGNIVACTGAATCQLGIARPRGAVPFVQEVLENSGLNLDRLKDFKIHISGCPNSCANQLSADLGFFGRVLRQDGTAVPGYNVVVGGVLGENKSRLAEKITHVAAFHLPNFIKEVLKVFLNSKKRSFLSWIQNGGKNEVIVISQNYQKVGSFEENPAAYYDFGSDIVFSESLKQNGKGEEN